MGDFRRRRFRAAHSLFARFPRTAFLGRLGGPRFAVVGPGAASSPAAPSAPLAGAFAVRILPAFAAGNFGWTFFFRLVH